jgi:hypothetical protein
MGGGPTQCSKDGCDELIFKDGVCRKHKQGILVGVLDRILNRELPHIHHIAMSHPLRGPFFWPNQDENRPEWSMVIHRDGVVNRIVECFGMVSLAKLATQKYRSEAAKVNANSLRVLVDAHDENRHLMVVDTEFHVYDDTQNPPRYERRDTYDLAATIVDWNGEVQSTRRWHRPGGKLSEEDLRNVTAHLAHTPCLIVCWGTPEFKFFKDAGRKHADGSDGINVYEAVLQAFPKLRYSLGHAESSRRFSLSMDLLTPLFGIGKKAFHSAPEDCEAEGVVIAAFIRRIARPSSSGGGAGGKSSSSSSSSSAAPLLQEAEDDRMIILNNDGSEVWTYIDAEGNTCIDCEGDGNYVCLGQEEEEVEDDDEDEDMESESESEEEEEQVGRGHSDSSLGKRSRPEVEEEDEDEEDDTKRVKAQYDNDTYSSEGESKEIQEEEWDGL